MRANEFICENKDITYSIVKPSQLNNIEIKNIAKLIASGQEVSMDMIETNLYNSNSIAYAKDNNRIVGAIVLKNPVSSYRNKVFDSANVSELEDKYKLEIGYTYVMPEYRTKGVGVNLCRKMVNSISMPMYATTREDNTTINKLLQFAGFNKTGNSFKSSRGDYKLYLWTKDNTNVSEDKNNNDIYYFAYGMLTNKDYVDNATFVGVGELNNYTLKLYTFANIEEQPNSKVYGALWKINRNILENLDNIEGYPFLYDRKLVKVTCNGKQYDALIYYMTEDTLYKVEGTTATRDYIDTVREGYNSAGIPIKQLSDAIKLSQDNEFYETTQVVEASPSSLNGSNTVDLVKSKMWLCKLLSNLVKNKNVGSIYILGSWYGNMVEFLDQHNINYNKVILVEPNKNYLLKSKELLEPNNKCIFVNKKAEDIEYKKPCIIINTSCNETGPKFLDNVPDNTLCLLQARNNTKHSLSTTQHLEDFVDYFPVKKIYYSGKKYLTDPETDYDRFMIIGRSGKKLDETASTGLGGGSAGNNGGSMVGGPTTYEQEYNMFKYKGPRRITAMTNEALDSYYP